jgi:hypothetical protein
VKVMTDPRKNLKLIMKEGVIYKNDTLMCVAVGLAAKEKPDHQCNRDDTTLIRFVPIVTAGAVALTTVTALSLSASLLTWPLILTVFTITLTLTRGKPFCCNAW